MMSKLICPYYVFPCHLCCISRLGSKLKCIFKYRYFLSAQGFGSSHYQPRGQLGAR